MRTTLNSATTFLREHKEDITDQMIESISVSDAGIEFVLLFPSEELLARFGAHNLPNANVEKLTCSVSGIELPTYRANFIFRRRNYVCLLRVDPTLGIPASRLFSDSTVATNQNQNKDNR